MKLKKKIKKIEKALAKNRKISNTYEKNTESPKVIRPGFSMQDLKNIRTDLGHNKSIKEYHKETSNTSSDDGDLIGSVEIYASVSKPLYRVKTYGDVERFVIEFLKNNGDVALGYGSCDAETPFKIIDESSLEYEDECVEKFLDHIFKKFDTKIIHSKCQDPDEEDIDQLLPDIKTRPLGPIEIPDMKNINDDSSKGSDLLAACADSSNVETFDANNMPSDFRRGSDLLDACVDGTKANIIDKENINGINVKNDKEDKNKDV